MSRGGWKDYGRGGGAGAFTCSPYMDSHPWEPLSPQASLPWESWDFSRGIWLPRGWNKAVRPRGWGPGVTQPPCSPSLLFKTDTESTQTTEQEIETPTPDEGRGQVPTRMGEILLAFLADILCTNKVLVSKIGKELLGFIKETPRKWKQTITDKKKRMAWKHKKRACSHY